MSDSLWRHGLQHPASLSSLSPRVCPSSCPLSWWCYLTISSSVAPFSSCPQSLPTSGSFPVSQLFNSSGQSIGASASASILPTNIQDWFPLELTGLISLQFKGLPRVFSNTTIQKYQFFGSQTSLRSNSHIHIWLLEKTIALTIQTFVSKMMFLLFNTLSRFVIPLESNYPQLKIKSNAPNTIQGNLGGKFTCTSKIALLWIIYINSVT